MEHTLVLVKPDGVRRNLCGTILARYEAKGLTISALKLMQVPRELAEKHYAEHAEKPFFGELVDFITSGPVLAMILSGENAVAAVRQLNGATKLYRGAFAVTLVLPLMKMWFMRPMRLLPHSVK